ncbi:MAG: pyrroline-5-carboxylate reductase [Methylocystaceae bacterium]
MVERNSLAVIGCGRMATAIVQGLKAGGVVYDPLLFFDINAAAAENLASIGGGRAAASMTEAVVAADMVLLAVKPQVMPGLISDLASSLQSSKLLISIAGGISTHYLEKELGQHQAVVRVMPNTPCLVGKGTLAVCKGKYAREYDFDSVNSMLASLGQVIAVSEEQIDAVTTLSGCGPAYFLLVAEAMIDAGVELGLSRPLATRLVQSTLSGTGMMWENSNEHPVILKEQVTSPGGSTIAALRVLEERGLRAAMINAINRAMERTLEIGRNMGKGV